MPAIKESASAPNWRGPHCWQQQSIKADGASKSKAARMSASTGGRNTVTHVGSAQVSGSQRSVGRRGTRRGKAIQQAVKNAAGIDNEVTAVKKATVPVNGEGNAGESCAWPAFARSAAEAEVEVLEAMTSLYADELKPLGRILRKRVAERIVQGCGIDVGIASIDALPEVDAKQVRAVCDACELLCVDEEDGGDWSAVFLDRPSAFVDVYSPADCYDQQLWPALQAYCESPKGQEMSLPGGRYACAQALKTFQLPFFAGLSLGRICHIVQLAISQKKILGYMNGAVVPYARSQSMMKEQCAMYGQPSMISNGQSNLLTLPIASLEVARKHVCEILDSAYGEVPLSNIKRLFRSRFQLELSETSFGHSKLSELLQDSKFSDICRVELRGHGYTVIQIEQEHDSTAHSSFNSERLPPAASLLITPTSTMSDMQGPNRVQLCADEPLSLDDMEALTEGEPMVLLPTPAPTPASGPAAPHWCLSASKDVGNGFVACSVQHTFLQYKVPQTPLPGPKCRSHSLPKDMGRSKCALVSKICSADSKPASVAATGLSNETQSTTDGSDSESLHRLFSHKRSESGSSAGIGSDEASFGYVPQLPSELTSVGFTPSPMDLVDNELGSESADNRVKFCPDEPLGVDDSGVFWGPTPESTPLLIREPQAPVPIADPVCASQFPMALVTGFTSIPSIDDTGIEAPIADASCRRPAFCPDEPLGIDEAGSLLASPKPSPAIVLPSPALSPSPLYHYSDRTRWRRHTSLPPQAPPVFMAPNSNELGHPETFNLPPPPPAQSGHLCSLALHASGQSLHTGYVIRLDEYL